MIISDSKHRAGKANIRHLINQDMVHEFQGSQDPFKESISWNLWRASKTQIKGKVFNTTTSGIVKQDNKQREEGFQRKIPEDSWEADTHLQVQLVCLSFCPFNDYYNLLHVLKVKRRPVFNTKTESCLLFSWIRKGKDRGKEMKRFFLEMGREPTRIVL